jgi:putative endonuclease
MAVSAKLVETVIPAKAGIQFCEVSELDETMEKRFFVYIMASGKNGTLYIGVTSNLPGRVWQHRSDELEGFTRKYQVHTLVWYEPHENAESAITREKQIKGWNRMWKVREIEALNPDWRDLYDDITA